MKMFETHENEIGQKVAKRVGKSELRMAGGSIVSSGKRYFPIRWQQCRGMSVAQEFIEAGASRLKV
jgi:hypothetical protein